MLEKGIVYLVGAGPGDRGLITVKGQQCLRQADVVLYDYLANPAFLAEASPDAELIYVGKLKGRHHRPQQEINKLLAKKAKEGKVVVRLKGGDPFVFGRGGEEAFFLRNNGIAFEVVPGVTSGLAAAAYAGIPLTHRDFTNSLGMVTGHEDPTRESSRLDWEKLATSVETLVFYMGMANLPLIVQKLLAHGRDPETPVAIIRWATTPHQETVVGILADIVEKVKQSGIKPPAIIVVGEVVNLRKELRWFDNRPLFGKRILVTRTAEQAGSFVSLLEEQGARAISFPVIEIVPPSSWTELDAAIADLTETDILVLTSANAVKCFFDRLYGLGKDTRFLGGVTVVAVGPKTAAAIEAMGIRPDLVPDDYRAEGVVQVLRAQGIAGKRILYPRAELARDVIPRELSALGAKVCAPVVYRTVPPEMGGERLRHLLADGEVDAITFTSSSTVKNLVEMLGPDATQLLKKVVLVSIGPQTTATANRLGLNIDVEPERYTLEEMVKAMAKYYKARNKERG